MAEKKAISQMTKAELKEYIKTIAEEDTVLFWKNKYNTSKNAFKEQKELYKNLKDELAATKTKLNEYIEKEETIKTNLEAQANAILKRELAGVEGLKAQTAYATDMLGKQVDLTRLMNEERKHNSAIIDKMFDLYEAAVLEETKEE